MLKPLSLALMASLTLSACVTDDSGSDEIDLSDLRSYDSSSDYAENLTICPVLYQQGRECKISSLPPLLVDSGERPTIDDVMARVAVSHQWMGDNFRDALTAMPEEVLTMMRPLAAIVIDDDIRPSFFLPSAGTIYLDPKYLWLTEAEKNTINDKEDFRTAFSAQMTTRPAWRYVDGDSYAYAGNDSSSRTFDEMTENLARLLFHELAHANDFIEVNRLASLNQDAGFSSLLNTEGGQMSQAVVAANPLQSSTMINYAAAYYLGQNASDFTQSLRGSSAGASLETEGANATYGYSTRYEDFAMLVEETMMLRHFGYRRDTAFYEEDVIGEDEDNNDIIAYNVYWGQRGRIGNDLVKPRALHAMQELLPDTDWASFFDSLAEPTAMRVGESWGDNLDLSNSNDGIRISADDSSRATTLGSNDFASPHQ